MARAWRHVSHNSLIRPLPSLDPELELLLVVEVAVVALERRCDLPPSALNPLGGTASTTLPPPGLYTTCSRLTSGKGEAAAIAPCRAIALRRPATADTADHTAVGVGVGGGGGEGAQLNCVDAHGWVGLRVDTCSRRK